jgi:hypothetical protein
MDPRSGEGFFFLIPIQIFALLGHYTAYSGNLYSELSEKSIGPISSSSSSSSYSMD